MSLLVCQRVGLAFGATVVFSALDARIEDRDRIGVVGANGAGKTTLLNLLAGELTPTEGLIEHDRRLRVGYLPQDAPEPSATTILGEVIASRTDLAMLHDEMTGLEQIMSAGGNDLERALSRYGDIQHTYEGAGGYELESRAREALGGLGILDADLDRNPAELSGGQKRRVELAKLLLQDADLLLIDEPTNHLDLTAIEWLEEFMAGVGAAFVLVSHDRRFLDRVCTSTLELAHGAAETYPGSYSQYVRLRGERRARRRKEWEAQQAHIAHQEDFIRRYKSGQRAKEARGRQKLLDRLPRVAPVLETRRPRLRFASAPAANVLLRTTDLVAGRGAPLARLGSTTIAPGDRIAIVGDNGSGKSTLLHTLAGDLPPVGGHIKPGARLHQRLYRQDLNRAGASPTDDRRTVLADLLLEHPVGEERGRTLLGALLFTGDDVHTTVGDLSGGERARLLLGKIALEETNLLLIDEPTNHLDISAQEVFEEALRGYPGGIVLVSHDRAFIDAVATRTWLLEDGAVHETLGNYSDMLRLRQGRRQAQGPEQVRAPEPRSGPGMSPSKSPPPRSSRSKPPREASAKPKAPAAPRASRAEVRRLEAAIAQAEAQLVDAEAALGDPATFSDAGAGATAGRNHARISGELAELYDRWAEIGD